MSGKIELVQNLKPWGFAGHDPAWQWKWSWYCSYRGDSDFKEPLFAYCERAFYREFPVDMHDKRVSNVQVHIVNKRPRGNGWIELRARTHYSGIPDIMFRRPGRKNWHQLGLTGVCEEEIARVVKLRMGIDEAMTTEEAESFYAWVDYDYLPG